MSKPPIVDADAWQQANAAQVELEKQEMRAVDALAAARRRMPMMEMRADYVFDGPDGPCTLLDLFDGRPQLIVYNFMLTPGSDHLCEGCSMVADNLPDLSHVRARDTTFVFVSRVGLERIDEVQARMGWDVPWFSSARDSFNADVGALEDGRDRFRYTVFLRDGDRVFKTYATAGRGVEVLSSVWALLDSTPYGRQETWQDAPEGWPQGPPFEWWGRHDEYDERTRTGRPSFSDHRDV